MDAGDGLKGRESAANNSAPFKPRALVLFSGGLDSVLAAELLRRLGVEVVGITFTTPFFGSEAAKRAARQLELPLLVVDITDRHLGVVRNPRFGYGKNLNPCIDCHALMVRVALEKLEDLGAHFLATGEVLGERPKSQNRRALGLVAEISGARDLLLRPLSAKLLPPTRPEILGWVERSKLMDIKGRSRKRQMQLAEEWGIREYQTPAGGCLLTDPGFSRRLKDLMEAKKDFDAGDVELVKVGRQFWIRGNLLVLGRRHDENERLWELCRPGDRLFKEKDRPGPTALWRPVAPGMELGQDDLEEIARLLGIYGKKKEPLSLHEMVEVTPKDVVSSRVEESQMSERNEGMELKPKEGT